MEQATLGLRRLTAARSQIPSFKVMDVMRAAAAKEKEIAEAGSDMRVLHLEVRPPAQTPMPPFILDARVHDCSVGDCRRPPISPECRKLSETVGKTGLPLQHSLINSDWTSRFPDGQTCDATHIHSSGWAAEQRSSSPRQGGSSLGGHGRQARLHGELNPARHSKSDTSSALINFFACNREGTRPNHGSVLMWCCDSQGALGVADLRRKLAKSYNDNYGVDVAPDEVVITTGSSGAFIVSFTACFDVGSRVAMATPGYPCYRNILQSRGSSSQSLNLTLHCVIRDGSRACCQDVRTAL